jgi:DNA-binding transcriptional MerR regulator
MNLRQISDNLMLTIDQISRLTGVRKSTLRYWEKSFNLCLRPSRTPSNRREYTLEDLERIKTIKLLLDQEHLTSEGVRLRLMEIYSSRGEVDLTRQAKHGEVSAGPPP